MNVQKIKLSSIALATALGFLAGVNLSCSTTCCQKASAAPNTLTEAEQAAGWKLLWDGKTTDGWRSPKSEKFPTKSWSIADGVLTVDPGLTNGEAEGQSGGDIITQKRYANFKLTADFKTTLGCNSGIKIFVQPNISPIDKVTGQPIAVGSAIGMEFQILDDANYPDAKLGGDGDRTMGSLYDLVPAPKDKKLCLSANGTTHAFCRSANTSNSG